jgi:hypothetical protein
MAAGRIVEDRAAATKERVVGTCRSSAGLRETCLRRVLAASPGLPRTSIDRQLRLFHERGREHDGLGAHHPLKKNSHRPPDA